MPRPEADVVIPSDESNYKADDDDGEDKHDDDKYDYNDDNDDEDKKATPWGRCGHPSDESNYTAASSSFHLLPPDYTLVVHNIAAFCICILQDFCV